MLAILLVVVSPNYFAVYLYNALGIFLIFNLPFLSIHLFKDNILLIFLVLFRLFLIVFSNSLR